MHQTTPVTRLSLVLLALYITWNASEIMRSAKKENMRSAMGNRWMDGLGIQSGGATYDIGTWGCFSEHAELFWYAVHVSTMPPESRYT